MKGFTSETAKAARAKVQQHPFDRKAYTRRWMARERARRIAVGVCVRCGEEIVEKFKQCNRCRAKEAAWYRRSLRAGVPAGSIPSPRKEQA